MTALIFATRLEADFAIREFGFAPLQKQPFEIFKKGETILAICGVGCINSALCTVFLLDNFKIEKIANFGACGILNQNFKLGEIYEIAIVKSADFMQDKIFKIGQRGAVLISGANPIKLNSQRKKFAELADLADMETYGILRSLELFNFDFANFSAVKIATDFSENCDIKGNILHVIPRLSQKIAETI